MGHEVPDEEPIEEGNGCTHCDEGETPKYLTVTFAGIMQCTECVYGGGGDTDCYKTQGQADALNDKPFLLTQVGTCKWELFDVETYGVFENWNCDLEAKTCTTKWNTTDVTPLIITVTKTGVNTIEVEATFFTVVPFFTFTGDVSEVISDCMDVSIIANDIGLACAVWDSGGSLYCIGGTMRIREGDWT